MMVMALQDVELQHHQQRCSLFLYFFSIRISVSPSPKQLQSTISGGETSWHESQEYECLISLGLAAMCIIGNLGRQTMASVQLQWVPAACTQN